MVELSCLDSLSNRNKSTRRGLETNVESQETLAEIAR